MFFQLENFFSVVNVQEHILYESNETHHFEKFQVKRLV
jgi:hypothetical protein